MADENARLQTPRIARDPLSRTIARNSIFSGARFVWAVCIYFVVTPYILRGLGPTEFGIWALVTVLLSYTNLTSFGLGRAVERSVAELLAKESGEEIYEVVGTALILSLLLGGVGCAVLLSLREFFVVRVFAGIPAELRDAARFVYSGTTVTAVISMIFRIFAGVLNGAQRVDLYNIVGAVADAVNGIGAFIVLEMGYGLQGLIVRNGIVALLLGAGYLWMVRRIFRGYSLPRLRALPAANCPDTSTNRRVASFHYLRFRHTLFSLDRARDLLRFGLDLQVIYIIDVARDPFTKALLSNVLPLNFVTYYELGARPPEKLSSLFRSLVLPVFPATADALAGDNSDNRGELIFRLYSQTLRYVSLLAFPCFTLVIILASPFLDLWVGSGYGVAALTIQLLALGWLLEVLSFPTTYVSLGMGLSSIPRFAMVARAGANVCLGLILARFMGYWGVVLAVLLAVVVQVSVTFHLFSNRLETPVFGMIRPMLAQPLAINLVLGIITWWLVAYIGSFNYLTLILIAVAYLAIYALAVIQTGWLRPEERRLIGRLLSKEVLAGFRSQVSGWFQKG